MLAKPTARRRTLLVVLLLLVALLHVLVFAGWEIDDAYIAFRYARNLADGVGLVYNAGERVEGFTSFAWVVVAAAGMVAHVPPNVLMPIVGTASALGIVAVVAKVSSKIAAQEGRESPYAGLIGAAFVVASPDVAFYAVSGLESALFALLVAYGAGAAVCRRPRAFAIAGALATLVRPEGAFLCAAGLAMLALLPGEARRARARDVAEASAILGAVAIPYVAFKLWYFHALLPNTLVAKPPNLASGLHYLVTAAAPLAVLLLGALGSVVRGGHRSRMIGALAFVWIVVVGLEGGDWMPLHRFLVPVIPLLAIAADPFLLALLEGPRARYALVVGALAYLGVNLPAERTLVARNEVMIANDDVRWKLFRAIVARGARSVGTFDIGLIGYAAPELVVTDLGGLTDLVIARAPGAFEGRKIDAAYLASRSPDVFVFTTNAPPEIDLEKGTFRLQSFYLSEDYVKLMPWFQANYGYVKTVKVHDQVWLSIFERVPRSASPLLHQ